MQNFHTLFHQISHAKWPLPQATTREKVVDVPCRRSLAEPGRTGWAPPLAWTWTVLLGEHVPEVGRVSGRGHSNK